jgi:hypothetical protein
MLRDRDQVVQTIYEIHAAALLAEVATGFDVHVPRALGSAVNYDVAAEIAGTWVHADSKTRRDEFPFNLPRRSEGPEGITGYFGSRATVDPLEAPYLGIGPDRHQGDPYHKATPEGSVVRDLMAQGLVQLPASGVKLVILGQIAGRQDHLERALYGPEIVDVHPDPAVPAEWRRAPTGAFGPGEAGKAFVGLSGVMWTRLWRWDGPLGRAYRLYENPNAREPMPPDVSAALRGVMARWARGGGE